MARRTAILHIGTPKTGTTSIERTLADNRQALHPTGFAYPVTAGAVSHTKLAAWMKTVAGARPGRLQRGAGSPDAFVAALRREIGALPETVHTVVFSNEHCFASGLTPGAVPQLRDMLDTMFTDYRVIVYLRRQDELAVSLLSTRLKAGRTLTSPFPQTEKSRRGFDYAACIAPWAAVFGAANVTVRIFARQELAGGDVVRDFLEVCGMAAMPQAPAEANSSLLAPAAEYLFRLNQIPAEPAPGAKRRLVREGQSSWRPPSYLRSFLTVRFGGSGLLPSRAEARAFLAGFAEGNEQVRAAYLPERPQLFPESFDRYPEAPREPTAEEVLDVGLAVVAMQAEMIEGKRPDLLNDAAKRRAAKAAEPDTTVGDAADLPRGQRALRKLVAAISGPTDATALRASLDRMPLSRKRKAATEQQIAERLLELGG